jgi:hypothetical protein
MNNPFGRIAEWLVGVWEQVATRDYEVATDPSRKCFTWERTIDQLGFADPVFGYVERRHGSYRKDNLGGLAYRPWVFRKKVGYLSEADPRLWTAPKSFRVQLVPWGEYKGCKHPVALLLDGQVIDFMLEAHPVFSCRYKDKDEYALKAWFSYLMKMHGRGYKVYAQLSVRASSWQHDFNLLVPHAPPKVMPVWKKSGSKQS